MTEYRDDIEEMEEDDERGFGEWLQDNLRILISVVIVLLLALGIYSYSKRSNEGSAVATSTVSEAKTLIADTADVVTDTATDKKGMLAQIGNAVKGGADKVSETATDATRKAASAAKVAVGSVVAEDDAVNVTAGKGAKTQTKKVTLATTDKEVADAFVMVANAGDGRTHLARRALAGYLSKNSVNGLTDAHKVYVEDYLQKAVSGTNGLTIGQEVRFSKDLIKQAIERAQSLDGAQVQNLQKYTSIASLS